MVCGNMLSQCCQVGPSICCSTLP